MKSKSGTVVVKRTRTKEEKRKEKEKDKEKEKGKRANWAINRPTGPSPLSLLFASSTQSRNQERNALWRIPASFSPMP
jgi:hypothetical protein